MEKLDCYKRQLKLYQIMLSIALDQTEAIRKKDYKKLLLLIKKRGKLMEEIEDIKEKTSFSQNLKSNEEKNIKEEIAKLLREIISRDKENESLLRNIIKKISLNLQQIDRGKLLQKAYKGFLEPKAKFFDQIK